MRAIGIIALLYRSRCRNVGIQVSYYNVLNLNSMLNNRILYETWFWVKTVCKLSLQYTYQVFCTLYYVIILSCNFELQMFIKKIVFIYLKNNSIRIWTTYEETCIKLSSLVYNCKIRTIYKFLRFWRFFLNLNFKCLKK